MKSSSPPYHYCLETLGSEVRIKIIEALGKGGKSVGELGKELGIEQSRLSHNLSALRQCNFVERQVKGKERVYRLTDSFVKQMPKSKNIFEALERHFRKFGCKCWRCGK